MQIRDSAVPSRRWTNQSTNGRETSCAEASALGFFYQTFKVTLTVPKRDYLVPILSGDTHTMEKYQRGRWLKVCAPWLLGELVEKKKKEIEFKKS